MTFKLETKTIQLDTPFTHNDIQYPANWLRLSTAEEKAAIGITEEPDEDSRFDPRFYWSKDLPKALDDKLEKDGSTTKGLKSQFIAQVKTTAGSILSQTDWMVVRKVERNIDIPKNIVQERSNVIKWADSAEKQINAATSIDQLQAVKMSPEPIVHKVVTK